MKNNFFSVWEQYHERLYKYVLLRVGTSHNEDALDIIQDVAFLAWKNWGALNNEEKAHAWMRKIAANQVSAFYRKRKDLVLDMDSMQEALEQQYRFENDSITRVMLYEILDGLPPLWHHILTLRFEEDMTMDRIAKETGVPLYTVKAIIRKSRGILKEFRHE